MTNQVYEYMKLFAVSCACGYFAGTIIADIIILTLRIVLRLKRKRAGEQTQP